VRLAPRSASLRCWNRASSGGDGATSLSGREETMPPARAGTLRSPYTMPEPQATKARSPANGEPRRRASVRASSWYLGYRSLWYLTAHCIHWIRARLQLESTWHPRRVHVVSAVDRPQTVDKQYIKGLRNTSGESCAVLCRPFEAKTRLEQYDLCVNRP
jgi:hypothetical protein